MCECPAQNEAAWGTLRGGVVFASCCRKIASKNDSPGLSHMQFHGLCALPPGAWSLKIPKAQKERPGRVFPDNAIQAPACSLGALPLDLLQDYQCCTGTPLSRRGKKIRAAPNFSLN